MSSYVNKKTRVFTAPGSSKVIQKRSESRLKNIKSATDNRAWTDCVEERRQYILELIKSKAGGLSLGKYIPIEVIIDCLLANKNAQIEELQRQLDAYKRLKLTDEQLRQLGMTSPGGDQKTVSAVKPPPKQEPQPVKTEPPKVETQPPPPETKKEEVKPEVVEVKDEKPPETKEDATLAIVPTEEEVKDEEPSKIETEKEPSPLPGPSIATEQEEASVYDKDHKDGLLDEKEEDIASLPLRTEFQKIVVGERDISESAPETAESVAETFVDIAEKGDEGLEKGTMEALSPTKETSEDKDDIINSLQQQLEEARRSNKLAERALAQLEDIEKILRESNKIRCNLTCKNVCQPCPTLTKRMNDMDNKKQKLEDLMKEKDELRMKISELEKRLAGSPPDRSTDSDLLSADELQKRLDELLGMDLKVQDLVNQVQEREISCQSAVVQTQDTDKSKNKIAELEKELDKCKLLKVENAKLQMKIQELLHLEKSQDELKKKIGAMEGEYKSKYDDLCRMESECNSLRNQLANCKLLQKERDMLRRQVGDLECCVADLEDEIKKLLGHIDRLTEGRDEQQTKMQTAMSDIRIELEQKTLLIEKSEEKLATVQEELERSIRGVKSETLCFKMKIEDLEKIIALKNEEIQILKTSLERKEKTIEDLDRFKKAHEEMVSSEDTKLKNLKQDLDNSMKQNEKLQKELEKMITFKNNEGTMKKIILQSRSAIKRVRDEIDRQYKEWEMGSGESCEKVEELKQIIKTLEAEISQMKQINDELRGALENQKTCNCLAGLENKTLKKHSTEIQNLAKHQVEELLDHLKKAQLRIIELEEMVDEKRNMKLRPETKDSEISCDCDKEDLDRLMKENEVLKQMLQVKESQGEGPTTDQDLLKEIERLRNELSSLESDKLKLEKENENLKTKSSIQQTGEGISDDTEKLQQLCSSQREEIERLKKQIESLKEALDEAKKQSGLAHASALDMQNLENSVKVQKEATEKMKQLNQELEERNKQLMKELDDLKKQNKDLNDMLVDLEKVKKQLSECLEKEKKDNKLKAESQGELEKENQNLKTNAAEMEKLRKQLADCLEKEKKINAEKSSSEAALRQEIEKLKSNMEELDKIKKQLTECLEREKKEKASSDSENTNLKNNMAEMEKLKKQLAECLDKEKKENENLKNALAEMEKMKKQLAECLEKEKNNSAQKASSEDELKKENDRLKNSLKELEDVKKKLAECLEETKNKGALNEDQLKKENEKLKNSLKELEDMKKKLAECLEETKIKGASNEDQLKKENDELIKKLKELDSLKAELAGCLEREKKAKGDAEEAMKKLANANSAKQDSNVLQSKVEELQKQLNDCLAREKKLAEKESFVSAVQAQPSDLDKLENEIGALRKKLEDAEKKLEVTTEENAKLKAEIEELKKKLGAAGKEEPTKTVQEEREHVDASKEDLQKEIDRLREKLQQQKSECDETIRNLKDQYERDVKKLKQENQKSIEELQRQHSEHLEDLETRHDSEVKGLRDELRDSLMEEEVPTRDTPSKENEKKEKVLSAHTFCVCSEMPRVVPIITTLGADIAVHEVESPYDRPGRWPIVTPPKDSVINRLLLKAIKVGMQKLPLEELQLIQSELLEATKKIKGKIPASMMKSTVEDSTALMGRIEELKDNLEKKQRSAKQKVVNLHLSIRAMEQKILETRNVLEKEKEHNAELRSKLKSMERDSQLMQVDRDLMRQQTNLQEQQIAKLQRTCQCKKEKKRESEEHKKKKYTKRSRRDSFSSDSTEIMDMRTETSRRRSVSTPVPGARTAHHIPQMSTMVGSDENQRKKRDKQLVCSCCNTDRVSEKKKK